MSFEIAQIIVRKGKAYIPPFGITPEHLSINIEPVYIVDLDPEQIVAAFEQDRAAGNPLIPSLTEREERRLQNLLPRVTGARTWKSLAATARAYTITFSAEDVTLRSFKVTEEGKSVGETMKILEFPAGTPDIVLVRALVEDAKSRPELGA